MSRRVLAIVIAVVAAMTVASASSLGSLTNVSLWGASGDKEACHVPDPPKDSVTFYSGLLGSLTAILLDGLTLTEVDYINLEGLSGDCLDMRPVVIVIGDHDGDGSTQERVLSRTMLEPISGTSDVTLPVNVAGVDDAELDSLLLTSVDPNAVRLGFCPVGVDSCDPSSVTP